MKCPHAFCKFVDAFQLFCRDTDIMRSQKRSLKSKNYQISTLYEDYD